MVLYPTMHSKTTNIKMVDQAPDSPLLGSNPTALADAMVDWPAFEMIDGDWSSGLLLLCDHASNAIPAH